MPSSCGSCAAGLAPKTTVEILQDVVHGMADELAAKNQELAKVTAAAAATAAQAEQQIAALQLQQCETAYASSLQQQ